MKMTKKAVGLYIGSNTVDVVELEKSLSGRPKLIKSGRVTISPQAGEVDDQKTIAAIQKVLTENDIKTKTVITALPKEEVMIRYFKMPYLPKKERDAAIQFEAKKYIPFKLEELISDFHIVESKKDFFHIVEQKKVSKKMEVIFVAIRKEIFEHHISLLKEAGLEASTIETPSFSLMRIFGLSGDIKKRETVIIINANMDSITISILKDNALYLTRNIKVGVERAEGEQRNTEFETLVSELQLSLDYYRKQFPKSKVDRIILSGEAELEGWDKLLNQELKIPVVVGNPAKAITGSDRLSAQMAVAAGLALRGLLKSTVDVDLVAGKKMLAPEAALVSKETVKKIIFQEVIVAASLLLLVHIVMSMQVKKVKSELNDAVALRPKVTMKLDVDSMDQEELEKIERNLMQKRIFLTSLIDKRICWTEKLSELGKLFPEGTWLSSLKITDIIEAKNKVTRSLMMQGGAFSKDEKQERQLINSLVDNVREDKVFNKGIQNINLSFIKRDKIKQTEITKFELTCSSEAYTTTK